MPSLVPFYSSVVSCSNTGAECPGIINDAASGHPPRGFYFRGVPEDVDLLLVAKNPGHPIGNETEGLYRGLQHNVLVERILKHADGLFADNLTLSTLERQSTRFHKNLLRYVSYFLDVPEHEVFRRCALTNLVKCSTVGEQDKLSKATMEECFVRHFLREVRFFRPRVLVAFGREIEHFLSRSDMSSQHGLPVVYVKHPSYYYRRKDEGAILSRIKTEIRQHL